MRWLGVKSQGSTIPTATELLRLVYVGRMCLAIAIYVTAALKIRVAAPLDILVTSLLLVAAACITAASYWHTHVRRRLPGECNGRGARSTGSRSAPGAARGGRRSAQPPDGRDHRGRGRPAAVRESGIGGDPRIPGARVAGALGYARIRPPRAGVLGGRNLHRATRRAVDARRSDSASSGPGLSDRRDDDDARWAGLRDAPRLRDLYRYLRLQAARGAAPARRASRGGGGAVVQPRARD